MIKIEKPETYGWEAAIRGMRNPMNSWDKSDSNGPDVGQNDLDLMKRLRNGGSDDRKFMRQIFVSMDVTAPLYWWKEMDQYKVGTVTNSCSTMHKIAAEPFKASNFSSEKILFEEIMEDYWSDPYSGDNLTDAQTIFNFLICLLNETRKKYLETKDKKYWYQMIQLLPSSYNQKRTWTANYEVLANIYRARKNHKLDEWRSFCSALEQLPYAKELIIGGENK